MALVAQFLGEEAVAGMSDVQIERTAELLHAEMLKVALTNKDVKANMTRIAEVVSRQAAGLATTKGRFLGTTFGG